MGKHTEWIVYQGKQILCVNGQNLSEGEFTQALDEFRAEYMRKPEGTRVLIDLSGTRMTETITAKTRQVDRELAAFSRARGLPDQPVALVGLSLLQRTVAQLIGRGIYYAENTEKAKEWLATH